VWRYIAQNRGVGLVNASLAEQLPRGVTLVALAGTQPPIVTDAVWHGRDPLPVLERALAAAAALGAERSWS
jgi:hypothetical protein